MKPLEEYLINRLKEIRALSNIQAANIPWPLGKIWRVADRAIKKAEEEHDRRHKSPGSH